jgi:hypothetical protein
VREVNRKILRISVALIFVAMLVAPVLAKSPKKIPVTNPMSGSYWIPPPPEEVWTSGNVQHGRGFTGGWASWGIEGDGVSLSGSLETYYGDYNVNLENGHGIIRRKMVITFDGGTFEGNNIQHGIIQMMGGVFPALVDGTVHAIFHGTGDYQGWTLVVTVEQPGSIREAYLLIP